MILIHCEIHPMQFPVIAEGYIQITDGKISGVGAMSQAPDLTGEVIDLKGAKVYPGFLDAHTHLGMSEDGVGEEGEDINEMSDPCTPHLRAIDGIDPLEKTLQESYEAGVTTMVSCPGSANPIAGQIVAMKTYGRFVDEMVIKEPVAMKFALGENPKAIYGKQDQLPMSRMAIAAIIREHLSKAKRYMEEKEKAEEQGDSLPDLDFQSEALIPVLKREIQAHFHAHRAYDIMTAIRISKEFNLDYVLIHCTEGHRIAEFLGEQGSRAVCGPIIGTRSKPELSYQTMENCRILMEHGVEVAICSDHPEVPAEYLPLSASLVANHGISEEQALKSITYDAAKILGLEHRVGSIATGLDADLLVFDGNPLDIRVRPKMVFVDGVRVL